MNRIAFLLFIAAATVFSACNGGNKPVATERTEDTEAKKLLQGIWVDTDEESVAFKVKGDTIYYPDSLSRPLRFAVYGDTLELETANISKYAIIRQTANIFEFKNQNGDVMKLTKGTDPAYELQFTPKRPVSVNQNKVIKKDTVVFCSGERYHAYIQVNPTKYKVFKTSYNDSGLETENVYFDNTVHISLFKQEAKVFSRDFKKADFSQYVPQEFLRQSVLSDVELTASDASGFHYQVQLAIPESNISYLVNVTITASGKYTMAIQK